MRDAPAPHPGLLFFARAKKSNQKKARPGWREYTRASAVPGPGADLTRHPASKIRRGHPVRAPFGALARNLTVRGRAIRGPQKNQPPAHAFVPSVLGSSQGTRFKLTAKEALIKFRFVIPAKAGIQKIHKLLGPRLSPW